MAVKKHISLYQMVQKAWATHYLKPFIMECFRGICYPSSPKFMDIDLESLEEIAKRIVNKSPLLPLTKDFNLIKTDVISPIANRLKELNG